ncbi:MAG: Rrf2 family transcriptional regulator [Deltaproteobacteria bacterium]|nr:Rrf2 family transcriptional regulator [Deltaproteobacteria bacterium]
MFSKIKREIDLVERHLAVLRTVRENQPIGIDKLATTLDLPKNNVRTSLHILENNGFIQASKPGAVAQKISPDDTRAIENEIEEMIERLKDLKKKQIRNL